jgi:murein L,D-transpeptidase YcbB/YkuD
MTSVSSRKRALLQVTFILTALFFALPQPAAQARKDKKMCKTAMAGLATGLPNADLNRWDAALKRLQIQADAGGWPKVPERAKVKIQPGESDSMIPHIRGYLMTVGDLSKGKAKRSKKISVDPSEVYDDALVEGVKRFQERHGLEPDGIIGVGTVKAMNVPVERRIRQLELNRERVASLDYKDEDKSILVNIPQFRLSAMEHGNVKLDMRVIVGQRVVEHRTPLFSSEMAYLVINPQWNVPASIMAKEMLPKLQKDNSYLSHERMKLTQVVDGKPVSVDAATVDWSHVDSSNFNYRISQDPGAGNALGNLKFIFPNKYNVYLHDTSSRGLFSRGVRDMSHGCIRIHKPLDMAEFVLQGKSGWDRDAVEAAIKRGTQRVVTLDEKIPVHLVYVTAWVDKNGNPYFLEDIYGYDSKARTGGKY